MFEIARTTSLTVLRKVPTGWMLGADDREVLLPTRFVPEGTKRGDRLEVFLYTDSEDRPIATTARPLAQAGEFAGLRVASVNSTGAFLDWGLPKDLLLPFRSQLGRLRPGQRVVVYVDCDSVSGRPVASAKVERFLEIPPEQLREGQAVEILVYEETELGAKAIVDGRFGGLLYADSGRSQLEIGVAAGGYIDRIRPDGKVDLSLAPRGRAGAEQAREILLRALERAGGRLELSDGSSPEEIRRELGLSKKAFKRAVGALYRERRIRLEDLSIEWTDSGKKGGEM
ncbi:MAG: GntR family transcriptional regulator [bacterium]|nr:GntR family transcriptional regulator [Deltaproteobacteria bacterium]MCP4905477.1 GntR family transcriptional regulator [bacterium]